MAQRTLKNTCLAYLMELDNAVYTALCVKQFAADENMTDVIAALGTLVNHDCAERETALQEFYVQWQHDPQVVEKWLALQAGSRLPDTLQHVKSLLEHPAFSMKNPNKVRALIGRFCQANTRFHDRGGEGYRFLADHVLQLDKLNPQIAARLVQAMARWQRYDTQRKQLMQAELQRIVDMVICQRMYMKWLARC